MSEEEKSVAGIDDVKKRAEETKEALKAQAGEVRVGVPQRGPEPKEVSVQGGELKRVPTDESFRISDEAKRRVEERRKQLMERHEELKKQREEARAERRTMTAEERDKMLAEREARIREMRARGPAAMEEDRARRSESRVGHPDRGSREKWMTRGQEGEIKKRPEGEEAKDDPSKVLALRFAKGEITEEEYRRRLAVLKELKKP